MRIFPSLMLILSFIVFGCSDPNNKYIEKVKKRVKDDAIGVELNYKSISFNWIDTLYVREIQTELNNEYNKHKNTILKTELKIKDIGRGKVFSKSFLTTEKYTELRNWEKNVGHPNVYSWGSTASWVEDGYKDYYEFAFANRSKSIWLEELCVQINQTDSLLAVYDKIEDGDLVFTENVLWFYKGIAHFHNQKNYSKLFKLISKTIGEMKKIKTKTDSLSTLNPEQIINYTAQNIYTINNPLLNGAEQELKVNFIFNSNFEIVDRENPE